MPTSVTDAVQTYVAASLERDPARRGALLEACFAEDARQVTRGTEARGRAAIAKGFDAFFADPRGLSARVVSAIDVGRTTFRFRAVVESQAGGAPLVFDEVGECDAEHRITLLLTFDGPLRDA